MHREYICKLVAVVGVAAGLMLSQPASAEGLRVAGSAFGVAAPDFDLARLPSGNDGDVLTIGRSSVRYALLAQPDLKAGVGVSNWETTLHPTLLFADRGYVPLLHAFGEYRFWRGFRLAGDIDALGGTQGRGLDAGMRLSYDLNTAWSISAAYRVHRDGNELRFDPVDQGRITLGTRLRF
ncbi:hypothetical protein GCM10025771_06930 [Niveibacterium umoris]|uniref:Uncharacterized protein n=1 Tax=Niveibacterium umoris TaxID=1193620 RepID=A0A840BJP4_9RHOO|nr:hypothetical protein [Niveibacterium umoris]MBB4013761.1 hypothetical protein [Niveibacterium umoris]